MKNKILSNLIKEVNRELDEKLAMRLKLGLFSLFLATIATILMILFVNWQAALAIWLFQWASNIDRRIKCLNNMIVYQDE